MKKRKFLFLLILILITCTGCSVEYNINITSNNIEEIINVTDYINENRTNEEILKEYNTWYPTFVNYIKEGETIETESFDSKIPNVEYHQKEIKTLDNGYKYMYKYTYPIKEYYDSYVLASVFEKVTVQKNHNNLVIRTSKENFLCDYSYFDNAKVNITIDPQVYEVNYTNTVNVNNNTYTWYLDRNNCKDSEIVLTLHTKSNVNNVTQDSSNNDNNNQVNNSNNNNNTITNNTTNNNQNNINNNSNEYAPYIFVVVAITIILIGCFVFKKLKEKFEKNSNIDD